MSALASRRITGWFVSIAIVLSAGCSDDERFRQHRRTFESLGATTAAVAEAWLAGHVSGTYARTALEQTFRLVEKERTALARSPEALAVPRGAELSRRAEDLSRHIAEMITAVREADAAAVRAHLNTIPIVPQEQR